MYISLHTIIIDMRCGCEQFRKPELVVELYFSWRQLESKFSTG